MLVLQRLAVSSVCIVPAIQHVPWMLPSAPARRHTHQSFFGTSFANGLRTSVPSQATQFAMRDLSALNS